MFDGETMQNSIQQRNKSKQQEKTISRQGLLSHIYSTLNCLHSQIIKERPIIIDFFWMVHKKISMNIVSFQHIYPNIDSLNFTSQSFVIILLCNYTSIDRNIWIYSRIQTSRRSFFWNIIIHHIFIIILVACFYFNATHRYL